jgi:hypothetical protein
MPAVRSKSAGRPFIEIQVRSGRLLQIPFHWRPVRAVVAACAPPAGITLRRGANRVRTGGAAAVRGALQRGGVGRMPQGAPIRRAKSAKCFVDVTPLITLSRVP